MTKKYYKQRVKLPKSAIKNWEKLMNCTYGVSSQYF